MTADDVTSLSGDIVLEAPAGSVRDLAASLNARVIAVGGATSAALTRRPMRSRARSLPACPRPTWHRSRRVETCSPSSREDRLLAAPSVADIAAALEGRWLQRSDEPQSIDRVMIGTVSSDAASPYFANRERTCVVTRYDKTDIQLAALLTDLQCMVITGGGEPSPYLIDRVRGRRDEVSVLATSRSTVEAVRLIEGLYGTSRFDGAGKLARVVEMLDEAGVTLGAPVAP